jgi:hypothetical protein
MIMPYRHVPMEDDVLSRLARIDRHIQQKLRAGEHGGRGAVVKLVDELMGIDEWLPVAEEHAIPIDTAGHTYGEKYNGIFYSLDYRQSVDGGPREEHKVVGTMPLLPGQSVQECVDEAERATQRAVDSGEYVYDANVADDLRRAAAAVGEAHPNRFVSTFCMKVFALLSLLDDSSTLLEREVLAADRQKFAESGDAKYVEKAIRRGVNAWNVGAKLGQPAGSGREVAAHYRQSHFAIRYMGRGTETKVARLRPIKGTFVHRDKITEVPTGYLDKEEE